MPYIVTPEQGTPLWADHQKTFKKGRVAKGTIFISQGLNEEYNVHKTDYVKYTPKDQTVEVFGDGYIEADNVIKHFVANPDDYTNPQPTLPGFEGTYEVTVKKIK